MEKSDNEPLQDGIGAVNSDKPHLWKPDIAQSVDFYNKWFMQFAPKAYRDTRIEATKDVEAALIETDNLTNIKPDVLWRSPSVLNILRMATAPPIARDRLIGLADVSPNLVRCMELENRIPPKCDEKEARGDFIKIGEIIGRLLDEDIFTWIESGAKPTKVEVHRASTIVADRLCGAVASPIIRNAQEQRQLAAIGSWLKKRGYVQIKAGKRLKFDEMKPGTFSFRLNVPVMLEGGKKEINIPIDTVIKPLKSKETDLPLFIEAKSAGDFTNTNKRRKEEAVKMAQLRNNYGKKVKFVLFLCGYFDSGYLGYEAAEGIDWVWEHRIDDLTKFGI